MSNAKCIMVQGTSSNAGKSVMVAALCRIYSKRGYHVAPFKSQNMSLNSYTTKENREIAIAQVLQAEAAGIEPSHHMNPILLKPKEDYTSQVIVQGKPAGDMTFDVYQNEFREQALNAISDSLNHLKKEYDLIIIEGAGSPAEINMRKNDLANMEIAHLADANVILVADIDLGGVFASIAGTFVLLDEKDRNRLKAVIINKFRGNLDILMPGITQIEEIIKVPVLGVLPYDYSLNLPEEDSASLSKKNYAVDGDIVIGVIKLPKISNFTDIDPLEYEKNVSIKFVDLYDDLDGLNAIIIPGTRNTVSDMLELEKSGLADKIRNLKNKIPIFGICGGFQMLGEQIIDENNRESKHGTIKGLGLLKIDSVFGSKDKIVTRSEGVICSNDIFESIAGEIVDGFELHEAETNIKDCNPLFEIKIGCGNKVHGTDEFYYDGAIDGLSFGTYFHGIFHNLNFRRTFTNYLKSQKGLPISSLLKDDFKENTEYSIDKLAEIVENNLNMDIIDKLVLQ